jgi:hypothetical protein
MIDSKITESVLFKNLIEKFGYDAIDEQNVENFINILENRWSQKLDQSKLKHAIQETLIQKLIQEISFYDEEYESLLRTFAEKNNNHYSVSSIYTDSKIQIVAHYAQTLDGAIGKSIYEIKKEIIKKIEQQEEMTRKSHDLELFADKLQSVIQDKLWWQETEEFRQIVNTQFKKHKWNFMDFGNLKNRYNLFKGASACYYLLLVDNIAILINQNYEINKFYLKKLQITRVAGDRWFLEFYNPHISIEMAKKEVEVIKKYKESLKTREQHLLHELDTVKENLVFNEEAYMLLTNFLDQYYKELYKKIELFDIHEDDLLSLLCCRDKQIQYQINEELRDEIENNFQMILNLFHKKGYLNLGDDKELGYLLLIPLC